MWLQVNTDSSTDENSSEMPTGEADLQFYQPLSPNPLVLIVEADEDARMMMKYLLQMWAYRVCDTENIAEALEITVTQRPDVILMGGKTTESENFAAVRQLREISASGKTQIFFISAFSQTAVRGAALAAGADEFLVKPIDFGHLENLLNQKLKIKSAGSGLF